MHLSIQDRCHGIVDTEYQSIKVISVEKELIIALDLAKSPSSKLEVFKPFHEY